jgi:hypothetical protein
MKHSSKNGTGKINLPAIKTIDASFGAQSEVPEVSESL